MRLIRIATGALLVGSTAATSRVEGSKGLLMPTSPLAKGPTGEFLSKKMKERIVGTALVMPAQVHIVKAGMRGREEMLSQADRVSVALVQAVLKCLAEKGIRPTAALPGDTDAGSGDSPAEISGLQQKFDSMSVQMMSHPKDIEKDRFTMGDDMPGMISSGNSNLVVFIRANGGAETKGKGFAYNGVAAALLFSRTMIDVTVTIVDA